MLKMGSNFTIEERHQRVDQVIIEVNNKNFKFIYLEKYFISHFY